MKKPNPRSERYDDNRSDPRMSSLAKVLKDLKISEDGIYSLHEWISSVADQTRIDMAINRVIPEEIVSKQIEECKKLERSAKQIAARLAGFALLADTGHQLGQTYGAVAPKLAEEFPKQWEAFAYRLARDCALLVAIAGSTKKTLSPRVRKTGRRSKMGRDIQFSEWFDRVKKASKSPVDHLYQPVMEGWNQYFKDDKICNVDTAKKALRQGRASTK